MNFMQLLNMVLGAAVAAEQALDIWTTWQVIRIGGRERNKIVQAVMTRVGVLPALVLLKTCVVVGLAWALWDDWPGSLEMASVLAALTVAYAWVLVNNFKALKAQRAIANEGATA